MKLNGHNQRVNRCRRAMATHIEHPDCHPSHLTLVRPRSHGFGKRGKHQPGWRANRAAADRRYHHSLASLRHHHRNHNKPAWRVPTAMSALILLDAQQIASARSVW